MMQPYFFVGINYPISTQVLSNFFDISPVFKKKYRDIEGFKEMFIIMDPKVTL